MTLATTVTDSYDLPTRTAASHRAFGWPVCGRVVDVSGGANGHALRCHLSHGHRGDCDDLGSAELEHWQASTAPAPRAPSLDEAKIIAAAQARTYEAMAHWKRERGWRFEADRLDAMAHALRHLVDTLGR